MRKGLVILLAACWAIWPGTSSAQLRPNAIAAVVADTVITQRDVEKTAEPKLKKGNPLTMNDVLAAFSEALQILVERQLILAEFKQSGFSIPDSLVDDQLNDYIRQKYNTRSAAIMSLRAEGRTIESLRQEIREDIIQRAMEHRFVGSVLMVSPFKMEAYYATNQAKFQLPDRVRLRMIRLNKTPDKTMESLRARAREILAKIDSGEATFAEMAIYGDGAEKDNKGDYGWIDRTMLSPELVEVAFKLKKGEHSGVIELKDTIYLLYAEEVEPAHIMPLAEVRDEIEKTLRQEEENRLRKRWIERLSAKIYNRKMPIM